MKIIYPPDSHQSQAHELSLFLGGSIELGKAENWQLRLIDWLADKSYADRLVVYNPRNAAWDASIPTDQPDHPAFHRQVKWELDAQDRADVLLYYFAADTLSPITLLELGTYSTRNPVIGSDPAYKRYGNIVITARHFGWNINTGWDDFVAALDVKLLTQAKIRSL